MIDGGIVHIYSPGCADYSYGIDGTPDLETVYAGTGKTNEIILKSASTLINFFLKRGIRVEYGLVLADVEAEDGFRQEKMKISEAEFVSRVSESKLSATTDMDSRFNEIGILGHPLLTSGVYLMRRDGFYTAVDETVGEGKVANLTPSQIRGNALTRRYLYQKWLKGKHLGPSDFDEAMDAIAKRYMIEFFTFGENMRRRKAIILSIDDPIMGHLYGVPCFILPKPKKGGNKI